MRQLTKVLVVLGTGSDNQPHAARARLSQEGAVQKAADAMGYLVGVASSGKARQLAEQLPEIKLYASGRGLVSRVKVPLYDALLAALVLPAAKSEPIPPDCLVPIETLDGLIANPWSEIAKGS